MTAAIKLKDACYLEENYDKPRQHITKKRFHFANKVCIVKAMVFPVVMYICESWAIKRLSTELPLLNYGAREHS